MRTRGTGPLSCIDVPPEVGVGLHFAAHGGSPRAVVRSSLTKMHVGDESGNPRPTRAIGDERSDPMLIAMTDAPETPDQDAAAQDVRELADIPAVEVISRAAVMLMSSAAEKLGLADEDPDSSARRDLDEARRVITALAGLITSSVEYLGPHAGPLREGLQALQRAFREASAVPDEPGKGPGEKYTGPVY